MYAHGEYTKMWRRAGSTIVKIGVIYLLRVSAAETPAAIIGGCTYVVNYIPVRLRGRTIKAVIAA